VSKKTFIIGLFTALVFLASFVVLKTLRQANFCANSISCIKDLSGNYSEQQTQAIFAGKTLSVPKQIAANFPIPNVLGNTTVEKRIEIDLTNQRIYGFDGDKVAYSFLISSGKWHGTPTGTFHIWVKLRYTRMEGGDQSIGTYYNLPNVPYVMFFYNDAVPKAQGFAIHGAYWHNNFGHPMSHGCVNMRTEDVEKLFYWADPSTNGNLTYADKDNPGTKVIIYGQAPKE